MIKKIEYNGKEVPMEKPRIVKGKRREKMNQQQIKYISIAKIICDRFRESKYVKYPFTNAKPGDYTICLNCMYFYSGKEWFFLRRIDGSPCVVDCE